MIGKRLIELRKERGMRQSEMAEFLGLSQAGYWKYEKDQAEPDIGSLIRIAELFGCSIDYLVGRTNVRLYNASATPEEVAHDIEDAYGSVEEVNSAPIDRVLSADMSDEALRELIRSEVERVLVERSQTSH